MKKLIALLLLIALAAAGSAAAATDDASRQIMQDKYRQGMRAHGNNRYSEAYTLLKQAAEAGNPNAQYQLAAMYDFGRGTKVNHEEANVWYLRAAEQGQDDAQYNLAVSYRQGEGIERDDNKAVYWLSRAAARGDQDSLKMLNDYGRRGYPEAQYALALIFRDGVKLHNSPGLYPDEDDDENIAPDKSKYNYWLNQAAENGHQEAARELKQNSGK
jgi:TPR repeat protein